MAKPTTPRTPNDSSAREAVERRRAEREAWEQELEEQRRNGRPKNVPACVFEEDTPIDSDEATSRPECPAGRGQRVMRMSVMRPKRVDKRKPRAFSIGSMTPGPL